MIFQSIKNKAGQLRGVRRRARTTDTTEELAEPCIYCVYLSYIRGVVMKTCCLAFRNFSVVISTCTKVLCERPSKPYRHKNGLTVLEHFNPVINIIKVCR